MRNAIIADRGPALLRELGRRPARHRPRVRRRTSSAAAPRRAARRSPSSSSRTRSQAQTDRTVFQKLREAALAYHLTRKWSKSKILTEYLNSIYFGNGAYGIESAARTYFGNRARPPRLRHARAPVRAASSSPTRRRCSPASSPPRAAYDPVAHPEAAKRRRNLVLEKMLEQGLHHAGASTPTRARRPLPAPMTSSRRPSSTKAPYFTTWVRQQLVDRFGARRAFEGGLQITTTLDLELQKAAESAVDQYAGQPGRADRPRSSRSTTRPARCARWSAGATTRRARSTSPPRASASRARRSSRSSSPRRSSGASRRARCGRRASAIFTVPGTRRPGEVRRQQLRERVRGLATLAGGADVLRQLRLRRRWASRSGRRRSPGSAERMGIRTPVSSNLAMTLGGLKQGVTPLDMAHAYETFDEPAATRQRHARRRTTTGPVGHRSRVETPERQASSRRTTRRQRTRRVRVQRQPRRRDREHHDRPSSRRAPASAPRSGRAFAAGKTGTTENNGDAWFVGFTDRWTVAVWVGYPDKLKPMKTEFGGDAGRGRHVPGPDLARLHGRGQRASSTTRNAKRARAARGCRRQPTTDPTATLDHAGAGALGATRAGAGAGDGRRRPAPRPGARRRAGTSQPASGAGTAPAPAAGGDAGTGTHDAGRRPDAPAHGAGTARHRAAAAPAAAPGAAGRQRRRSGSGGAARSPRRPRPRHVAAAAPRRSATAARRPW